MKGQFNVGVPDLWETHIEIEKEKEKEHEEINRLQSNFKNDLMQFRKSRRDETQKKSPNIKERESI